MRALHVAAALLCFCITAHGQSGLPPLPAEQDLQKLAAEQRWSDIVSLLQPVNPRPAAADFYYGLALAQLGRFVAAQSVLGEGHRLAPADPRFPVELAGIAFKRKNYPQTIRRLQQALRLAPGDEYTNNFLGTTYYLEGNLEASLKYWNRAGKPRISAVTLDPTPRLAPALLDHAFTFSPAATLALHELIDTNTRVHGLGVFPKFHFDLNARPDGSFDVSFQNQEKNGFGDSKLESLFLFFRGLPFHEVNPEYFNLHGDAINFESMFRWDAQKRRIFARLSSPFERSAKYRWSLATDLRGENWAIRNGFRGPAPVLAGFNMRLERFAFQLASYAGDRFGWQAGAELSHRDFRSIEPAITTASVLSPQLLAAGYQLEQQIQVASTLLRVPEQRFTVTLEAASNAARLWSQRGESSEKLTGAVGWRWSPQLKGNDYETSQHFRFGKTFGQAPFDELFILGLERDNNLPLRAHIGTRDGLKGSAPLGSEYFLENWDLNKNIYGNGIVQVQLGPFLDIGKIADPGAAQLGSRGWLYDSGAQAKLRVFGAGLVFSYGRDLRAGNNAFYLTLLQ